MDEISVRREVRWLRKRVLDRKENKKKLSKVSKKGKLQLFINRCLMPVDFFLKNQVVKYYYRLK